MMDYGTDELERFQITFTFEQHGAGQNNTVEAHNAVIMVLYMIALLEVAERLGSHPSDMERLAAYVDEDLAVLIDLEDAIRYGAHPADQVLIPVRKALANNLYAGVPHYRISFRSGSSVIQVAVEGLPHVVSALAVVFGMVKVGKSGLDMVKAGAETMKAIMDVKKQHAMLPLELEEKRLQIESLKLEAAERHMGLVRAETPSPLTSVEEELIAKQELRLPSLIQQTQEQFHSIQSQAKRLSLMKQALSEEPCELTKVRVRRRPQRRLNVELARPSGQYVDPRSVTIATPTKNARYVDGKRVGPVTPGGASQGPGVNARIVSVPEQDLPENLTDITMPPEVPWAKLT